MPVFFLFSVYRKTERIATLSFDRGFIPASNEPSAVLSAECLIYRRRQKAVFPEQAFKRKGDMIQCAGRNMAGQNDEREA